MSALHESAEQAKKQAAKPLSTATPADPPPASSSLHGPSAAAAAAAAAWDRARSLSKEP
jgi:hypothetical protein